MEIVCCRSTSDAAQLAFRLRYEVFGSELGFQDPALDHESRLHKDNVDDYARIYVAIKEGKAIATARVIYDRDVALDQTLLDFMATGLGLDRFSPHKGTLAVSTKFAISPNHRGTLAANLITTKMYGDFLDDGIQFLFSMCAPYLISFYSQLGFQMYSRSMADNHIGLLTPIVLVTRDWRHLRDIRSPLFKQLEKRSLCDETHPSVHWFYDHFGKSLESFVASYDDSIVEKLLRFSEHASSRIDLQDVGIFNGMSSDDIKKIIGSGKLLQLSAGDVVIQAGHSTDEMFIVIDGEISVSFKEADAPSFYLGPGQVFGEIAMLSRTSRTADCAATSNAQLAIISRHNLERLIKVEPNLAARLLYNLSRSLSYKLRRTNEHLKSLCIG